MQIGNLVHFNEERFFDGAVQLRWVQERPERARAAAEAFVFHGPKFHGASDAVADGIESAYRLTDTASFVAGLVGSFNAGQRGGEVNPFCLTVAGYGTGKSHLATALAALLGAPGEPPARQVLAHLAEADRDLARQIETGLAELKHPVLVLCLDGMAGFHLGQALNAAVLARLAQYGLDAGAIRELSPRFQVAEQFVQRNYSLRTDAFSQRLPGLDLESIVARLREQDDTVYAEVDTLYAEANGMPIPATGQESAQDLINTLADVYCGADGPFAGVLILFDEFGRYLEYAAEKPRLAGDAALQQLYQGVQDNAAKVRFLGLIQYELKAYLRRFGSADLRHLQRYITRYDAAEKRYLSTNLETLFAHMIGKDAAVETLWQPTEAVRAQQLSWQRLSRALPGFDRLPVWADPQRFARVIVAGAWPLHPLATWFLTRQRDVVQSRSALTFIKDVIGAIASETAVQADGRPRQVSAAELVLHSLLPELIAAEQQTGSTVAETLQMLLEKFRAHLGDEERRVLAGTAVLEKMRVGKQTLAEADALLAEATALLEPSVKIALARLTDELGALEWNADLGQYELIADASTRGQFQHWLRARLAAVTAEQARQLFVARAAAVVSDLGDRETDFAQRRNIATPDWCFASQLAHRHSLAKALETAFADWKVAVGPRDPKGRLIFLYLHSEDDQAEIDALVCANFQQQLAQHRLDLAPIWVVGVADEDGRIAAQLGRLQVFDDQLSADDQERFRRFLPEERQRATEVLKAAVQETIRARLYWVAGLTELPQGRLNQAGAEIFAQVYPKALPFPFDGFATSAGGGPADAAQLTRGLIAHQVDGAWVQAQPKRLQNRVNTLLVQSWRALPSSGQLAEPKQEQVKVAFEALKQAHGEQPERSLWESYRELIAPPYGMNAASAGILLGLLIGGQHPPRRLEQGGELVAAADWVTAAFPVQRGRHQLELALLEKTRLRFLAEDSEGRWREFLTRWETETRYEKLVELARNAEKMRRADPIPEILEGRIPYLVDKSTEAERHLREFRVQIEGWEQQLERAARQNQVGELLKTAAALARAREDADDEQRWPARLGEDCEKLLLIGRELVGEHIGDWIPRQGCQNVTDVGGFRTRMDKAIKSLRQLGFTTEAQALEEQANRAIMQVENRQQFRLILDESDEYPRLPEPDASTLVRELRDGIQRGDVLIEGVESAASVLNPQEIQARVGAIRARQQRLQKALAERRDVLGAIYQVPLEGEAALTETLAHLERLQRLFLDTPDEPEIAGLMRQLKLISADLSAWESGDLSPERLRSLLEQQIPAQLAALNAGLEADDIEPAWDIAHLYQALAAERIGAQEKRSSDWMKPRLSLADQLPTTNRGDCERLRAELAAAPAYLSEADRHALERLLALADQRLAAINNEERQCHIAAWRAQLPREREIETLDKHQTEALLRAIEQPPVPLTPAEQTQLEPLKQALNAHYDNMSAADILARIDRLSIERQWVIYEELAKVLSRSTLVSVCDHVGEEDISANHGSFAYFMEQVVLPQKAANPTHMRLDGQTSGGNREPAGFFQHQGKIWRVHADSHYEPLMLAYRNFQKNPDEDPFIATATGSGQRRCLVLKPELQQQLPQPRFKHLYIYET
ncbi:hypothetical protein Thiowin_02378 [Thiorhodovibrio winogradskyi]|uniref:AAA+ ATPase domain-containing protein n=1 Tax=Thiorhodovibrio winogradskyi TaxID=77007 RepID=A0ABZ0SAP7_9GAMM|nr:hypothetical protein [Thiorhodovibrio winogradskyi]